MNKCPRRFLINAWEGELIPEGLERIAGLVASQETAQRRVVRFLELFRHRPSYTADEIMRELKVGQKTFERDVSRLRSIGLLHGGHSGNEYRYYISYEGFSIWLKTLRDLIYSLMKRGGRAS